MPSCPTKHHKPQGVDKPVENRVDNPRISTHNQTSRPGCVHIHRVMAAKYTSFPPFHDEKSSKLINFAANQRNVEKRCYSLTVSQKILIASVDNAASRVYNQIRKHYDRKFCTYPRHIIRKHSFFQEKKNK